LGRLKPENGMADRVPLRKGQAIDQDMGDRLKQIG
jgi:hypothetical protein